MLDSLTKVCTKCLGKKLLEEFHKEKLGKYGVRSKCKPCLMESNAIAKAGKVYVLDQEKARARRKKWEDKNSAWRQEYARNYQQENKDKINKRRRKSYATSDSYKAYVLAYVHKRRDSKHGTFSNQEWLDLVERYDYRCLVPGCIETNLTVDHVVPLSKGGSNAIENIQPLCRHHNAVKHTDIKDYR